MLAKKNLIVGFGHSVWKMKDPRSNTLKELSIVLAEKND